MMSRPINADNINPTTINIRCAISQSLVNIDHLITLHPVHCLMHLKTDVDNYGSNGKNKAHMDKCLKTHFTFLYKS